MKRLLATLVSACCLQGAWADDAIAPIVPALEGVVLEVLDGGAFVYLRLQTADGNTWAVVRRAPVAAGTLVRVEDPEVMHDFESRALQRRFDFVVFGTLAGVGSATTAMERTIRSAAPAGADSGPSGGKRTASADVPDDQVPKADGADARTVAEVNAERLALKDKPVTIRARVVKVTGGVMGKTWIHLRDGSGSAADNSNEIVATSKEEPKPGDVVVATGVVRTDVNLGSGYAYSVLVEDASLRK